jgi:hypothetical protein
LFIAQVLVTNSWEYIHNTNEHTPNYGVDGLYDLVEIDLTYEWPEPASRLPYGDSRRAFDH